MQRRFWHPCLLRSESCSRHAYSLARDERLWTDVPLQIHVRSLQNDYAAEPQARPLCHYVIQLDVKLTTNPKIAQFRLSRIPPAFPRIGRGCISGVRRVFTSTLRSDVFAQPERTVR